MKAPIMRVSTEHCMQRLARTSGSCAGLFIGGRLRKVEISLHVAFFEDFTFRAQPKTSRSTLYCCPSDPLDRIFSGAIRMADGSGPMSEHTIHLDMPVSRKISGICASLKTSV